MKKSIVTRSIILMIGAAILLGTAVCFAEGELVTSEWTAPIEAGATEERAYELVVIEPEEVPLAEGPAALQKLCVLHYALFALALVIFFVLRSCAVRLERENREIESLLNVQ